MTASFTTLKVEEIGRVRRLTLDRPDHHNPLTPRCIREILRAVAEAEADAGASVIIIRSTGRSFSSGYGFIAGGHRPRRLRPPRVHRRRRLRHARTHGRVGSRLGLRHPGHRPGAGQLPRRRHGPRSALRPRRGGRRRPHRLPAGPFHGRPAVQHVALPPRPPVDQAVAADGRHADGDAGADLGLVVATAPPTRSTTSCSDWPSAWR